MKRFNIGQDFSKDPAGRYYTDGDASGEKFREEFLKELILSLNGNDVLEIILDDDVETYGSSFLNEAFGGMVKFGYIKSEELVRKIRFSYSSPDYAFYANRALSYIREAKFSSEKYIPTRRT